MSDPYYNDKMGAHYKSRDRARVQRTPNLTNGSVRMTIQEVEFPTSAESMQWLRQMQKSYETRPEQSKSRRMKLQSIASD